MTRKPKPHERRRLARPSARRSPSAASDIILIVTEGEKTEVNYFKSLTARLRLMNVVIEHPPCTDPLNLTRHALEKRLTRAQSDSLAPYDQIWIVCDTEERNHPYRIKIREANELIRQEDLRQRRKGLHLAPVKFAASSPCFEFWLLLHFAYSTPTVYKSEEMAELLRSEGWWPEYGKGARIPPALIDRVPQAMLNADQLRNDGGITEPATDVDLLVSNLNGSVPEAFRLFQP